jgi:uncharacterized protein (TIGR02646 family)
MRPVERGPWPVDDAGNEKQFHPYTTAKADLLDRLGEYCSYCERPGDVHIEHVVPRKHRQDLKEAWDNFLLGCSNCNGTKGATNRSRQGYMWPDQDDTEEAFKYLPDGRVKVCEGLPDAERTRAAKLMSLVGLDRVPKPHDGKASDRRWSKRREVWGQAEEARRRVAEGADPYWVLVAARNTGFWSVWMTVFAEHGPICTQLRDAFPGTKLGG